MSSDFFGEYVAPGLLLGGAAVTAYRGINEIRANKTISAPFLAQKSQKDFLNAFKSSRTGKGRTATDIAGAFFPDMTIIDTLQNPEDTMDAIVAARRNATKSLLSRFGLSQQAQSLGINPTTLEGLATSNLESLISQSPQYKQHMEIAAKTQGLFNFSEPGRTSMYNFSEIAERTSQKLISGMEAAATDEAGNIITIASLKDKLAVFDPKHSLGSIEDFNPSMLKEFGAQFRGKDDLLKHVHSLYEQVSKINGTLPPNAHGRINLVLKTLGEGAQKIATGVEARMIGRGSLIHLPFEDATGVVRTGHGGHSQWNALRVLRPDIKERLRGGGIQSVDDIVMNFDTAVWQDMAGGRFQDLIKNRIKGKSYFRRFKATSKDDIAPLRLMAVNPSANARARQQIYMRPLSFGANVTDAEIEELDKYLNKFGINSLEGVSASQATGGVRITPNKLGHVYGADPTGISNDNKSVAQVTRPKMITEMNRAPKDVLMGVGQDLSEDYATRIKVYAMEEDAANTILSLMGRGDINLHEDEAILADTIRYKDAKNFAIADSFVNKQLLPIINDETEFGAKLRVALRDRTDITALFPEGDYELLEQGQKDLVDSLTFKPGEVLGVGQNGAYEAIPDSAVGYRIHGLDVVQDGNRSIMRIAGILEQQSDVGDKYFGWKHIIKEKMAYHTAHNVAALHTMVSEMPDFQEALYQVTDEDRISKMRGLFDHPISILKNFEAQKMAEWAKQARPGDKLEDRIINYSEAFAGTDYHEDWKRALRSTSGIQMLEAQGMKKMGDSNMPQATHWMMEHIASRRDQSDLLARSAAAHLEGNKMLGDDLGLKAQAWDSLGFAEVDVGPNPGLRIQDGPTAPNIVNRFEAAVSLSAKENGHGLWSASRFFDDVTASTKLTEMGKAVARHLREGNVQAAEAMTKEMAKTRERIEKAFDPKTLSRMTQAAQWNFAPNNLGNSTDSTAAMFYRNIANQGVFREGPAREIWMEALEKQLRYGVANRTTAIGGQGQEVLGSGRLASINLQRYQHLETQGGVMKDIANELVGRQQGVNLEEAEELYRRAYVFHKGNEVKDLASIKLEDIAQKGLDDETLSNLFSSNQEQRDKAFSEVRSRFGIEQGKDLVFDADLEGKRKQIYHPQIASRQTGEYATLSGQSVKTDLDTNLYDILDNARAGNVSGEAQALNINSYSQTLSNSVMGKGTATAEALAGKVTGSARLQARSQASAMFWNDLGKDGQSWYNETFGDKVGIRREVYQRMLTEKESLADLPDRLADLSRGKATVLIGRSPDVELHRVTLANTFDLGDAVKTFAIKQASNSSDAEIMAMLWNIDKNRHESLLKHLANLNAEADDLVNNTDLGYVGGGRKARRRAKKALAQQNSDGLSNIEAKKSRAISSAYIDAFEERHKGTQVFLPRQLESPLGADFDDDQLDVYAITDKNNYESAQDRVRYQEKLMARASKEPGLKAGANDVEFLERMRGELSSPIRLDQIGGEEDFLYKFRQRELYKNLKDKRASFLTVEGTTIGTREWHDNMANQRLVASLEKAQIGQMSNATDFTRTIYRRQAANAGTSVNQRIFSEMIMGIMPESILKARQVSMKDIQAVGGYSGELLRHLSGQTTDMDMPTRIEHFRQQFHGLHGTNKEGGKVTELVKNILHDDNIRPVLEAAETAKKSGKEFELFRFLRNPDPNEDKLARMINLLNDPSVPNPHGNVFRGAIEGRFASAENATMRRLKNTASGFSDAYDIMLKHKKPLLIGAGLAVATSMLLGSPGNISSEEADQANMRHQQGNPTTPPTDMSRSARLDAGSGNSIRVRGRSTGNVDQGSIASSLGRRFPGADVSMNVDDYRKRINEEYIRRRMENG